GSDVEIGQDIGRRLGLQVQFVNSVFSTIVQALMDGRCDIIISAQPSTATTKKRVDMITYFQAGQSFVVAKGNPQNIKTQEDLSGLTLGVAKEGISVDKTHPELKAAVQSALSKMVNDGTYLQILTKYGIESGNVFAK